MLGRSFVLGVVGLLALVGCNKSDAPVPSAVARPVAVSPDILPTVEPIQEVGNAEEIIEAVVIVPIAARRSAPVAADTQVETEMPPEVFVRSIEPEQARAASEPAKVSAQRSVQVPVQVDSKPARVAAVAVPAVTAPAASKEHAAPRELMLSDELLGDF